MMHGRKKHKKVLFFTLSSGVYCAFIKKIFLKFLKYHHSATFRYRIATSIALYQA